MAIWVYEFDERDRERIKAEIDAEACIYCRTPLTVLAQQPKPVAENDLRHGGKRSQTLSTCPVCGWWFIKAMDRLKFDDYRSSFTYGASSVLRHLDLSDQTIPLAEIRNYLAARYDDRFSVDPARFEELVASVYRGLGYDVEATGRTGDGGIDAVLRGPGNEVVGVQIKRYRNKIEAEQIRSFTGALCIKGLLRGVFVTTSQFTRGAQDTSRQAIRANVAIELVDAHKFYEQLRIAQRDAYRDFDEPGTPYENAILWMV